MKTSAKRLQSGALTSPKSSVYAKYLQFFSSLKSYRCVNRFFYIIFKFNIEDIWNFFVRQKIALKRPVIIFNDYLLNL